MNDKRIEKIIKEKIVSRKKVEDAISNDVYYINDKYVMRYKQKDDIFYHPRLESRIDSLAKENDLSPFTIHFFQNGDRLSRRLYDYRYIDINNQKDIKECANIIRKFHSVKLHSNITFNILKRLKYYQKQCEFRYENENKIIQEYKKQKVELTLCHNDLVRGNILIKGNTYYLIDYEYSSYNDLYFDLASFISENNINDIPTIKLFLDSYFLDKKYDQTKFIAYLNITNLLWMYWAIYKYNQTKENIFLEIKNDKLDQLKRWDKVSHL